MNSHNQKTLKQAIGEMMKIYQMNPKIAQTRLKSEWESIIGKTIARYTERVYVKDKVLFLYVKNATLKNELFCNKTSLIKRINEAIEPDFITDVVIR
jgi:predicted nucleic acid-binding Zn ribbon protein